MDERSPSIQKGTYYHSKTGRLYEVVGVAIHTENDESLVVYRPLYASQYEFFVRPYAMFIEEVEVSGRMVPRFEKVEE